MGSFASRRSTRSARAITSAVIAALAFVAFVACGSPPPPESQAQPSQPAQQSQPVAVQSGGFIDRLCNTLCKKMMECTPNWDADMCQKNCRERGSPARAYWRADYAKATLACLDASGCDVMAKGDATEKKCFTDTRPEPTDAAKHYCEVAVEKERTCAGAAPDMPGCMRTWGMIDDAQLKDMLACQDQPCGKAASCAKSVVGFPKPAGE
jgi:hypothetical protein